QPSRANAVSRAIRVRPYHRAHRDIRNPDSQTHTPYAKQRNFCRDDLELMSPQSTPEKQGDCEGRGPESGPLGTETGDFTEALALISRLPLSTAEKTKAVRLLLSSRRVAK
ncbi:MAG: hypothetical protein NTU53_10585, partial [Planctomycetota bacterium]|nr:hypothetical protein [Planctomycetota bacterium]